MKGLGQQQGFVSKEEEVAFHTSDKSTATHSVSSCCDAKKFFEEKWHSPQFNVSANIFLIKFMDLYVF